MLKSNSTLKTLNLRGNSRLGKVTASSRSVGADFAEALRSNSTLEHLDLEETHIEGVRELAAVARPRSAFDVAIERKMAVELGSR